MKKTISFYSLHVLHWAVLYGAFAMNLAGAMSLLKFFVWGFALTAWILFSDDAAESFAKEKPIPLRNALSWVQAWITLILLVWNGMILTGIAWSFTMVASGYCRQKVKELRTKKCSA